MRANLKTLIVDDEPLARSLLASMLAPYSEIKIVGMVGSAAEARSLLAEETIDLLFLDVEMPGASGLDLRGDLDVGTSTIFVTAFEGYTLEAFDFGARDYLLKPVDSARLALALERILPRSDRLEDEREASVESIITSGKLVRVPHEEILWIEACQNYTVVRTADGETREMIPRTMVEWERLLPAQGFGRLSRSVIINLKLVDAVRWKSRDRTLVDFSGSTLQLVLGRVAAQRLKARLR